MNLGTNSTLLEALDFKNLSPQEQEELLLEINDLVFKGSMLRIVERMDDSTRAEFHTLMEGDVDEAVLEAFLAERVPDANKIVAETVTELTDDILAVTGTNTK